MKQAIEITLHIVFIGKTKKDNRKFNSPFDSLRGGAA